MLKKIYYFGATHWDREWYKTVDQYRFKLIPTLNKIIDTLDMDENFEIFTLDGQTSVLEDYLEVQKNTKYHEKLKKLISDKRLLIGPWYTMPDQFLVSTESIIQNLSRGHDICKDYETDALKLGYVCDTFGHVANLPQIFNGFNIKNAVLSRGTNDHDTDCFFNWSSPDGSEVLTFKAPEVCGYGSFFFEVLSTFYPNYASHLDEITEKAIEYINRELTRTDLPYVILMDGMDHETIHEFMPELLKRLELHFNCPVEQAPLDLVFASIKDDMENNRDINSKESKDGKVYNKIGELSDLAKAYEMHAKLIPHTLSSRYDLKQANDYCQNLLEHYAMPIAAIKNIEGNDPMYSYIDYAYGMLLQNHAHDSICGCSIDDVHREMLTRFTKVKNTSEEFFFEHSSKEYFDSSVEFLENSDNLEKSCFVKVFNPLPYTYEGALELDIDFGPDFLVTELPFMKFEQRNSFKIFDEDNNEIKYNIIKAERKKSVKQFGGNKRLADTHRVAIVSTLKPMGYTTFEVKPFELPYRITEGFSTSQTSCENDFINFEIQPNGTISITDKTTNKKYTNLHSFIDTCETGDGWFHIRPINDRTISSLGSPVSIEKTFDGYAECKFTVRYELKLPKEKVKELDFYKRSDIYETCIIRSEFTIERTSALVAVRTEIENNIKDHRLQLHLPTNLEADYYTVNQSNLLLNRPFGQDHSHYTWKEHDITERAFENLVMMRGKDSKNPKGLMFISKGGLHEVSCNGDKDNSLDITLLRCFNKTVNTNGEPDGQLQGLQVIEYALMPLSNESDNELILIKDKYVSGYKYFTIPSGVKTSSGSAFNFSSKGCSYLTTTVSKHSERSIIIRAVNNEAFDSSFILNLTNKASKAYVCNNLEDNLYEVAINNNSVEVAVPKYKMINLKLVF